MKFGIFVFGDNHPEFGRSNQKYDGRVGGGAGLRLLLARRASFVYWCGTCVSPPMLIAAIAQRTKRIRLGPAVAILPFHKTHRSPGSKIPNFDVIKKEWLAVFSRPEDAAAIFREHEKTGVSHIICMVNFGGAPMSDVRRTLELMSKEVIPSFR